MPYIGRLERPTLNNATCYGTTCQLCLQWIPPFVLDNIDVKYYVMYTHNPCNDTEYTSKKEVENSQLSWQSSHYNGCVTIETACKDIVNACIVAKTLAGLSEEHCTTITTASNGKQDINVTPSTAQKPSDATTVSIGNGKCESY